MFALWPTHCWWYILQRYKSLHKHHSFHLSGFALAGRFFVIIGETHVTVLIFCVFWGKPQSAQCLQGLHTSSNCFSVLLKARCVWLLTFHIIAQFFCRYTLHTFVVKPFRLSDGVSRWVKDIAWHASNKIKLEKQLRLSKCDRKENPQVWATG